LVGIAGRVQCWQSHGDEVTQFIQTLAREAWWLMNIELRSLWLDHPGRDRAQFTVRTDDGDAR
jgi:hypothetical protein